ncbi:hypothetical protein L6164_009581 [Bauhinia variegata]|uniref:Uncharacterized protein n=1 Tax=Bauhinia variegata TaxID=167791 RepID=A0ACB9PLJ3_BAUVA|nr:hypothetical protein L6164_009581 [Bauhinia variegata]
MPRPWLLVCLLLLIVFTSHFDWKQQYGNELEASPSTSQKLKHASESDDSVKEKIILSQEKSIRRLNKIVQRLREQLLQCKGENEVSNATTTHLTELTDRERQPVSEN